MTEEEENHPGGWMLRVTWLGAALVLALLVAVRLANRMVYPVPADIPPQASSRSAGQFADVEEVWFEADDGTKLYGWLVGAPSARRRAIYFHGNGSWVGPGMLHLRRFAALLDARIFAVEYRGYNLSEGSPSEAGFYSDARGAWRHAVDALEWSPGEVILWGRSLGGGVATGLAMQLLSEEGRPESLEGAAPPRALVLESTFTSLEEMAQRVVAAPRIEWFLYSTFRNLERAPDLCVPAFVIHNRDDDTVPFAMGEELYQALPGPKRFYVMEGADHNRTWEKSARVEACAQVLGGFLDEIETAGEHQP